LAFRAWAPPQDKLSEDLLAVLRLLVLEDDALDRAPWREWTPTPGPGLARSVPSEGAWLDLRVAQHCVRYAASARAKDGRARAALMPMGVQG